MTLSTPEFVGRAPILDTVLQRARSGRSTVLTGPVGIGRSRLLSEVASRAERGQSTTAAPERLALWVAEVPAIRTRNPGPDAAMQLTSRKREVVALAARGLPDRGVAEELGISVRTAQTHLSRAFTKLGLHHRSELVGLLDDLV